MMISKNILRWVLPLSLSLNVFIGVWFMVHPQPLGLGEPPPPQQIIEDIAATLPSSDGAIFRKILSAHIADFEQAHQRRRAISERLHTVLSAAQFDPDALRAVFAEGLRVHETMDSAVVAAIIDAVGKMSTEGRMKLAEWKPPGTPPPPH